MVQVAPVIMYSFAALSLRWPIVSKARPGQRQVKRPFKALPWRRREGRTGTPVGPEKTIARLLLQTILVSRSLPGLKRELLLPRTLTTLFDEISLTAWTRLLPWATFTLIRPRETTSCCESSRPPRNLLIAKFLRLGAMGKSTPTALSPSTETAVAFASVATPSGHPTGILV